MTIGPLTIALRSSIQEEIKDAVTSERLRCASRAALWFRQGGTMLDTQHGRECLERLARSILADE